MSSSSLVSRSAAGAAATVFAVLFLLAGVALIGTSAPTAAGRSDIAMFSGIVLGLGVIAVLIAIGIGVTLPGVFTARRGWPVAASVVVAVGVMLDVAALLTVLAEPTFTTVQTVVMAVLEILGLVTIVLLLAGGRPVYSAAGTLTAAFIVCVLPLLPVAAVLIGPAREGLVFWTWLFILLVTIALIACLPGVFRGRRTPSLTAAVLDVAALCVVIWRLALRVFEYVSELPVLRMGARPAVLERLVLPPVVGVSIGATALVLLIVGASRRRDAPAVAPHVPAEHESAAA